MQCCCNYSISFVLITSIRKIRAFILLFSLFLSKIYPSFFHFIKLILPREILEYIANFLGTNDQYNCLTVCKSWYPAFLFCLYRYIHLLSDEKTIQLQSTLKNHYQMGYLVRHVSFQAAKSLRLGLGVQIKEHKPVKISQDVLDTLDQSCPLIESLSLIKTNGLLLHYHFQTLCY